MDGVPQVTDRIIAGAGSTEAAIAALRGDEHPDSQAFIEKYDSVSVSDRSRLTLEQIFTAAGLSARRFVEIVTGALMQQSADVTQMMVSIAQPKVIAATVKAAIEERPIFDKEGDVVGYTLGDVKAQEIFHKATGFLPMPKGSTTIINNNQQNNGTSKEDESDEDAVPLQSMDDYLMELQDVLRPQAQLPAPNPIPVSLPQVEYVEVEI